MVHETFILATFTFKHLYHHDTKACILAQNKPVSRDCSQEVTACFMSACCKSLVTQELH